MLSWKISFVDIFFFETFPERILAKNVLNAYPTFGTEPWINCFFPPKASMLSWLKWRSQTTVFDCGNGTFPGYVDLIKGIHCSALLGVTLRFLKELKIRKMYLTARFWIKTKLQTNIAWNLHEKTSSCVSWFCWASKKFAMWHFFQVNLGLMF